MKTDYDCADCGHTFTVSIADDEMRSSLRTDRPERCPACGQRKPEDLDHTGVS